MTIRETVHDIDSDDDNDDWISKKTKPKNDADFIIKKSDSWSTTAYDFTMSDGDDMNEVGGRKNAKDLTDGGASTGEESASETDGESTKTMFILTEPGEEPVIKVLPLSSPSLFFQRCLQSNASFPKT